MTAEDHFLSGSRGAVALWHPEKNGDLTLDDLSPGSKRKVWWQCEQGHAWQAMVYSVSGGSCCPYCSGRNAIPGKTDLATTHPHILPFWSPKNKQKPAEVTGNSHRKAWWVCGKGHEWEAVIGSVAGGSGCPYCSGKRAIPGESDLATLRPDLVKEWDVEKNQGVSPGEILPASHEKVWWVCGLGHSYRAMVFARSREKGSGCPYCSGRKVLKGVNDLQTLRPEIARQWYQPLNGTLKPEDVTLGSNKKVWWKCRDGHIWQAFIYARTKKNGTNCPVCSGKVREETGF